MFKNTSSKLTNILIGLIVVIVVLIFVSASESEFGTGGSLGKPSIKFTEEDGAPVVWNPTQVKHPNGSVATSSGGVVHINPVISSTTPITRPDNEVLFPASSLVSSSPEFVIVNGNIGIGATSSPAYLLSVVGDAKITNDLFVDGKIGIATTPSYKLHILNSSGDVIAAFDSSRTTGQVHWRENTTYRGIIGYGDNPHIFTGASTDSFSIRARGDLHLGGTGDNLRMTLNTTGVGIYTTNPLAPLHLPDDRVIGLGDAPDAKLYWITDDADANALLLTLPNPSATNTRVFIVGGLDAEKDLGLFDGLQQIQVAVLDSDADSYIQMGHSTDDTPTITTNQSGISFDDNNITNVGDISLDTISSDADTTVTVNLGTDAGDDFVIATSTPSYNILHCEGDTGRCGIGTNPVNNADVVNKAFIKDGQIVFIFDGSGVAIGTTGTVATLRVPYNVTTTGWDIVSPKESGDTVVDVWFDSYANYPPTVADTIAGSEKPTLTAQQKNQDTSLTTWSAITKGGYLAFNIDSVATTTRFELYIYTERE